MNIFEDQDRQEVKDQFGNQKSKPIKNKSKFKIKKPRGQKAAEPGSQGNAYS